MPAVVAMLKSWMMQWLLECTFRVWLVWRKYRAVKPPTAAIVLPQPPRIERCSTLQTVNEEL